MMEMKKDAAVFLLFGQSNATGHNLPMSEEDKITAPLANVYGLHRDENQSFDTTSLVWRGWTSDGMNLGETQDHTYSVANCLARLWQDEIDVGNPRHLPDLYIVHISIGGQGITEKFMWYPEREEKLIPGQLGTVDISLYPLAIHVLSMLQSSMEEQGKNMRIVGLHWRGGEQDTELSSEELSRRLKKIYQDAFDGFDRAAGVKFPVVLHRNLFVASGETLKSMETVNEVFETIAAERENCTVFNAAEYPGYLADELQHGIFLEDLVHYTPEVNRWVAKKILDGFAAE